jgi:hypothetical protein
METAAIAIQTLLALVSGLLPEFGVASTSVIDKVLAALQTLLPIISSNFTGLLGDVQNVIATLQTTGNLTAAQLATLQTLSAQADAAFESAATADGLPNPAPSS